MTTMIQRVAARRLTTIKEQLLWASDEINTTNRALTDVVSVLTAREHSELSYEGFGSLSDDNSQIKKVVGWLYDAEKLLDDSAQVLRVTGVLSEHGTKSHV